MRATRLGPRGHEKLAYHLSHGVARGREVYPQATCRVVTATIKLTNPATFSMVPAWGELMAVTRDVQLGAYSSASWRERAWAETDSGRHVSIDWQKFKVAESASHPHYCGLSVGELAGRGHTNPVDVMCDLALADDLETRFDVVFANDDPAKVGALLKGAGVVLGLSDAGAHVGQLCDATLPVDFLAEWIRDRELMPLEAGVHKLTGEPARVLQLRDRGTLAVGAKADIVIFDLAQLDAGPRELVRDLPGGTERILVRQPRGLAHIIVNGTSIRHNNEQLNLSRLPGEILDNGGPS